MTTPELSSITMTIGKFLGAWLILLLIFFVWWGRIHKRNDKDFPDL